MSITTSGKTNLFTAIAIGVGSMIGSGWLFAAYYSAQYAGPASIFSWIIGAAIALCLALLLAEVVTLYQSRGLMARLLTISHNRDYGFVVAISNWLGMMLLFQVIGDQMLGWYSIKGYSAVIHTYYTYDNAPTFFKDFLRWSEQYANILLPIQFTFELIASISLITLLFRFPLTLLAALFFAILSFSELGVPATWPATAQSPLTWIWELWLTTFIILITGSYYTIKTFKALSWRNIIFGNKIFRLMQRFNQSFFLVVFIIIEIILFIAIPYPTMRYMRALDFS